MKENEELYAKIEELEKELAEERIRRKITEDNSDCALWEYEIATKKYVLSRKLGRKVEHNQYGHRKLSGADAQLGICTSG